MDLTRPAVSPGTRTAMLEPATGLNEQDRRRRHCTAHPRESGIRESVPPAGSLRRTRHPRRADGRDVAASVHQHAGTVALPGPPVRLHRHLRLEGPPAAGSGKRDAVDVVLHRFRDARPDGAGRRHAGRVCQRRHTVPGCDTQPRVRAANTLQRLGARDHHPVVRIRFNMGGRLLPRRQSQSPEPEHRGRGCDLLHLQQLACRGGRRLVAPRPPHPHLEREFPVDRACLFHRRRRRDGRSPGRDDDADLDRPAGGGPALRDVPQLPYLSRPRRRPPATSARGVGSPSGQRRVAGPRDRRPRPDHRSFVKSERQSHPASAGHGRRACARRRHAAQRS